MIYSKNLLIRINPELLDHLKQLAESRNETVSGLLRLLIQREIDA